ncbi:hypothetical protein [Erwinia mallotivora]|uniref:hypothetical protein n=1 Tax=Erwinia mallotivora TaxID=69222 RepID=UPI0021BDF886|nr:hypothetical protein [Erwinia mallotivora]
MSQQHPVSAEDTAPLKKSGWRSGRRLVWTVTAGVVLAGSMAFGYSAFSLAISDLDGRLSRLESQRHTVASVETVSALQSEVEALSSGLHDAQKNLADLHTQVGAALKQVGEDTAQRQSMNDLRNAMQGQENRLNALADQLSTLKKAAVQAAPRPIPTEQSGPAAKKPRPADARRPAAAVRMAGHAPFVLTGVERRGSTSWAAIAPRGYRSLSEVTLTGVGETIAGWTLVGTGDAQATFRVNGRLAVLRAQQE